MDLRESYIKFIFGLLISPLFFLIASCQSDFPSDNSLEIPEGYSNVSFSASVNNSIKPSTKAVSEEYQAEPVRQVDFPINFYIQMVLEEGQTTPAGSQQDMSATYEIPSGSQAYLRYKYYDFSLIDQNQGLNWGNATATYNFWSWTTPWNELENLDGTDDGSGDGSSENPAPGPSGDQDQIIPDLTPKTITIESSALGNNNKPDNNMAYLEKFIGAKSGPHSYQSTGNGEVQLEFKHLVSKIVITRFTFIDMQGNYQESEKANITFLNMPDEFTFYPHPDGTETYIGSDNQQYTLTKDGAPIAVTDFTTASNVAGPTFAINNLAKYDKEGNITNPEDLDIFYICPEIDFSKVEFMVEMVNPKYNTRGAYFGNFENVVFNRVPGLNYDNPTGGDSRILHAGEVMEFNLQVKEIGGSGIGITIVDWTAHKMGAANYHPHKGFYDSGEAKEARDLFAKAKNTTTQQQADNLYDLYGDGVMPDDETVPDYFRNRKIFKLYGEITVAKTSATATNGMSFPLWDDYILDGMGYTINFQPADVNPVPHTITVGKMKDVYLTDGTYTVYIDDEGKVWVLNPNTGDYVLSDRKLSSQSNALDLEALTKSLNKT